MKATFSKIEKDANGRNVDVFVDGEPAGAIYFLTGGNGQWSTDCELNRLIGRGRDMGGVMESRLTDVKSAIQKQLDRASAS